MGNALLGKVEGQKVNDCSLLVDVSSENQGVKHDTGKHFPVTVVTYFFAFYKKDFQTVDTTRICVYVISGYP